MGLQWKSVQIKTITYKYHAGRKEEWRRGRMVYRETNYLYPDSISGNRRNRKTPRWCTAQLTNNKKILTKRWVMAGLFVVNNYRQFDNNYLLSLFGSFNGQQLSTIWQQLFVRFSLLCRRLWGAVSEWYSDGINIGNADWQAGEGEERNASMTTRALNKEGSANIRC